MILKKKYLLVSAFFIVSLFTGAFAYYKLKVRINEISGFFQSPDLKEISGIATSQLFEDTYYVHNDSGDTSRFFAVDPQGKLISTFFFPEDHRKEHPIIGLRRYFGRQGPWSGGKLRLPGRYWG